MIMRNAMAASSKQCAIAEGMETLRQDGWRRVRRRQNNHRRSRRVTQTDEVDGETTEEAAPVAAG